MMIKKMLLRPGWKARSVSLESTEKGVNDAAKINKRKKQIR